MVVGDNENYSDAPVMECVLRRVQHNDSDTYRKIDSSHASLINCPLGGREDSNFVKDLKFDFLRTPNNEEACASNI